MTDSHVFSLTLGTSFVVTTGLAIAYWTGVDSLTSHDVCYGAPYNWAIFSKWYLTFSAILLFSILLLNRSWKYDYSKLKKTIIYILFAPNLGTIVYLIGSMISFHNRYQCLPLHDLIVVSFWISIAVIMAPFMMCGLLCLSGGIAAMRACCDACLGGPRTLEGYAAAPEVHVHTHAHSNF